MWWTTILYWLVRLENVITRFEAEFQQQRQRLPIMVSDDLEVGDWISRPMTEFFTTEEPHATIMKCLQHHGVVTGKDEITHFHADTCRMGDVKIITSTLEDFLGDEIKFIKHGHGPLRHDWEEQRDLWDGHYNLFTWNCEHFAMWLIGRVPHSYQIEAWEYLLWDAFWGSEHHPTFHMERLVYK